MVDLSTNCFKIFRSYFLSPSVTWLDNKASIYQVSPINLLVINPIPRNNSIMAVVAVAQVVGDCCKNPRLTLEDVGVHRVHYLNKSNSYFHLLQKNDFLHGECVTAKRVRFTWVRVVLFNCCVHQFCAHSCRVSQKLLLGFIHLLSASFSDN